MRLLQGKLTRPDNLTIGSGELQLIAAKSHGTVLEGTRLNVPVEADGSYSTNLKQCKYFVYFEQDSKELLFLGSINITDHVDPIDLATLLERSNPIVDLSLEQYIQERIQEGLSGKQDVGDYLTPEYDADTTPTTPQQLQVKVLEDPLVREGGYCIGVVWEPSSNIAGSDIEYHILCENLTEPLVPNSIQTTSLTTCFVREVGTGCDYKISVTAKSSVASGRKSLGTATATVTVSPETVPPVNKNSFKSVPGIKSITLLWDSPDYSKDYEFEVFSGNTIDFSASYENMVYRGKVTSCIVQATADNPDPDLPYYFKIRTRDRFGEVSTMVSLPDPYYILKLDATTLGNILDSKAISAHHIADGAVVEDKIAARAMAASKLAVVDLNSLVENGDFTATRLNTEDEVTCDRWNHTSEFASGIPPVYTTPYDSITLSPNSDLVNEYEFHCVPGEKLYASCKVSWDNPAGSGERGLEIVFLDKDGLEISTGNTFVEGCMSTEDAPASEVILSGFVKDIPVNATKGFVKLKVGSTLCPITFHEVNCRLGASTLIEPKGISADRINVLNLFAQEMRLNEGGNIRTGENTGRTDVEDGSGIIMNKEAITLYDAQGQPTTILKKDGSAQFTGVVQGGSFKGNIDALGGAIVGGTIVGGVVVGSKIHSPGKDHFLSTVPGFFMEGNQFAVGDDTNFMRYDGESLRIMKNLAKVSGMHTCNERVWDCSFSKSWGSRPGGSNGYFGMYIGSSYATANTHTKNIFVKTELTDPDLASEHSIGVVDVTFDFVVTEKPNHSSLWFIKNTFIGDVPKKYVSSKYVGISYNKTDGYIYLEFEFTGQGHEASYYAPYDSRAMKPNGTHTSYTHPQLSFWPWYNPLNFSTSWDVTEISWSLTESI